MRLTGDDTGATRKLVHLGAGGVRSFDGWGALMASVPSPLLVSPAGCQFLLAYGLVPPPFTLYQDVYVLGIGDRLEAAERGVEISVDFPYLEAKSTGREHTDPARLEQHLAAAVERAIGGRPALLMQSAGKDSAALLIGLAAAGQRGVRAVTYRPRYREDEAPHAAELARRFGLEHQVVEADPVRERELLLELCGSAPVICADVALAGYLRALDGAGVDGGVVIDGLGGDVYMGYVQPRAEALLSRLSIAQHARGLWGRIEPARLGAIGSYAVKSALMYPAERCLSGSHLSPRAVTELLPYQTPFSWFFERLDQRVAPMGPTDRRAYVRGRIYDGAGTMEKARLAASRFGAESAFPFTDAALIAHYFNLPASQRYDERARITKLPLRALLAARIGESRYFAEKGSFRYDVLAFARANTRAIESEIRGAGRVLQDVDRWATFLLSRLDNYVHAYSLFTLFMLAAWLNRRPAGALALLDGAAPKSARVAISP